jgi:asparaginyl-tRNA synthetase
MSRVQTPFLRLSYDEAIDVLRQKGFKVFWGQALDGELERKLSSIYEQPFFVTNFPVSVETSSFESSPERPELTLSSDLLAPHGFGEIGSGAQMIIERKTLSEKMIEENIADSARQWYLDLMCSSSGSQSGFALGVERIVQWICSLADIRETVAFPRFFNGDLV